VKLHSFFVELQLSHETHLHVDLEYFSQTRTSTIVVCYCHFVLVVSVLQFWHNVVELNVVVQLILLFGGPQNLSTDNYGDL